MLKTFQLADYSSVWNNFATVKGLDSYIVFRAGMNLGHQKQALSLVDRSPSLPSELKDLMRLQYSGTVDADPAETLHSIQGLSNSYSVGLPAADRFLTMSYVGTRVYSYHLAAAYAEKAQDLYLGMGFIPQASTALYNLAIARLSLGQQELFDQVVSKLKKLAVQIDDDDTNAHICKLEGWRDISNGNYNAALAKFHFLSDYYIARPGSVSFGSCLATYYYLVFKSGLFDVLLKVDQKYGKCMPSLLSEYSEIISAYKRLYSAPLNHSTLQTIKNCTHQIFYLDLVSDLAMEMGDFSYLMKVSEINLQHHRSCRISFNQTEMIPKMALALYKEGQDIDAKKYAADFLNGVDKEKSPKKFEKYRNMIEGILKRRTSKNPELKVDLNFRKKTLTYGDKKIDLPTKGHARKLIEGLANPKVSNKIEDVARFVYGCNSPTDRSKITALLHRLKQSFPKKDLILIEEDRVNFNSAYSWRVTLSQGLGKLERYEIIIDTLKRSNVSLKLSDIERITFLPRRTIQMDLKDLADKGTVKKYGKGRGVCYCILPE